MRHLILLFLILFNGIIAFAQEKKLKGKITTENGESLVGVTILVKGTLKGASTDVDGNYELTIPEDSKTLVFSYTGFLTQEIEIGDKTSIDIVMKEDVVSLSDLIVIGHLPPVKKKDLTGSVSTVTENDMKDPSGGTIELAMQGKASGVFIQSASGTPGSQVNIRVRGSTSISAGNEPLFVVDGVPVISSSPSEIEVGGQNPNVMMDINPNDIASIEILKDAATSAIYGSRAANGVVLITTKKGASGKTKINLYTSYGLQEPVNLIKMADTAQYREQMLTLYGDPNFIDGAQQGNTDWLGAIFQTAAMSEMGINISGGDEETKFYTSLSHTNQEGIIKTSGLKRYSARLNLDHRASERLSFATNIGFTQSKLDRIASDNSILGIFPMAVLYPSTVPIKNPDGTYGVNAYGFENPMSSIEYYDNNINTSRIIGNIASTFKFTNDLSFRLNGGIDNLHFREEEILPSALMLSTGEVSVGESNTQQWLTEYTLNYSKSIGTNFLAVVAGGSYQMDKRNNEFMAASGFPTDNFIGLSSAAVPNSIQGGYSAHALRSYFANVNYSINDKYIFTGSFRADGSSRFVNNKYGFFPSFSGAWRLSSEEFMSGLTIINDLKLRAGWGLTGNNGIGNYDTRQLYEGGSTYQGQAGIAPTQLGNPDLKWETTSSIGTGIDYAILKSRISGSIDFYIKNTKDLLLDRPLPATSGFSLVTENIGEVRNTGVEFSINTENIKQEKFSWTTNFNISYNENKVTKLYLGQPFQLSLFSYVAEGQPIGSFFGHVSDGVFQNQAEVDAHAKQPNAAPGDIRFKDISGGPGEDGILGTDDDLAPDGIINDFDRTIIGNAIPKITGGITNTLTYAGFELNAFFQYALGQYTFANGKRFSEALASPFNNTAAAWEGRWQKEGDDEDFPRAVANDPNGNNRISDRYVENSSYMRLKILTLAYTLKRYAFLDRFGITSARINITGQNLLTFTKYDWFDPEVSFAGNNIAGIGTDFLTIPSAKSILVGINVGF